MKIVLVLGASGSGKTTYIENEIIKNRTIIDDSVFNIPVSIVEDVLLFGKYNVDKRCKGCDTLSMAIIDKLIVALKYLIVEKKFNTLVVDGDRVNNSKMFNFLSQYKDIVEVVYIKTPLQTIYKRLPECNKTFVKTTDTKTINSIMNYHHDKFKIVKIESKDDSWERW